MNIIDMHRAARIVGAGVTSAEKFLLAKGVTPVGATTVKSGACRYYDKVAVERLAPEYEAFMQEVYHHRAVKANQKRKANGNYKAAEPKAAKPAKVKADGTVSGRLTRYTPSAERIARDQRIVDDYHTGDFTYEQLGQRYGLVPARIWQILHKMGAIKGLKTGPASGSREANKKRATHPRPVAAAVLKASEINPTALDQLTTLTRQLVVEVKALDGRLQDLTEEVTELKASLPARGIRPAAPLNPVLRPEVVEKIAPAHQ